MVGATESGDDMNAGVLENMMITCIEQTRWSLIGLEGKKDMIVDLRGTRRNFDGDFGYGNFVWVRSGK